MGRQFRLLVALIAFVLLALTARAQKDPFGAPRNLQIEVRFSAGTVIGRVSDQPVKIGEQWVDLGDVASFNKFARGAPVTLRDGQTIKGDFAGVDPIDVTVGEVSFKIDLSKAVGLTISEAKENRPNRPDKTARRPAPAPPSAPTRTPANAPAPLDETAAGEELQSTVVALPTTADDVVPAAGGQKLLLWFKKLNKIAVVDVKKAEISGYIPAPADSVAFAGGADKVLVALNDQNIIQRWNLQTLQKERTASITEPARSLVMGWASDGPAVMNARLVVDPISLKPTTVQDKGRAFPIDGRDHHIRASGDGSTFTSWRNQSSPSGIYVGRLTRQSVDWKYDNTSAGVLMPSPDGSLILTTHGGLFTPDIKPVAGDTFKNLACIPSYHTSYFLGVRRPDGFVDGKRDTRTDVSIYTNADRRLLLRLQPFPEMQPVQGSSHTHANYRTSGITIDKRYHFIPTINKLVTIPETNDQLVVRDLDIMAAMDKAGTDYLYVDSIPNRSARNGQLYDYQIAVRAKKGPVRFNLDSGPRGMTITKDGLIKWQVPKGFFEKQVGVIVTITDSTGQEAMHTYSIDMGFGAPAGGGGIVISPRDP